MTALSDEQEAKRASIQKSATTFGVIVGVLAGLIALWALGGQGAAIRYGGAAAIGLIAGFGVFKMSFNSGASSAKCAKCGAVFSRSRTDRAEVLSGSEAKEERKTVDGVIEVTTWIEETYDVADTYTCANCGDVETKSYTVTRRKDEETSVERPKTSRADRGAIEDVAEDGSEAAAQPTAKSAEGTLLEGGGKKRSNGDGRKGRG